MMNRAQLYNPQYSLSLTALVTSGFGRALFTGSYNSEGEEEDNSVFITETRVCAVTKQTKITLAIKIEDIESVNEENGIICIRYKEKQETKEIKFQSEVSGAIVFFISTKIGK